MIEPPETATDPASWTAVETPEQLVDLLGEPEGRVPRRAVIASAVEPSELSLEELDAYYRPENYERGLYA